MATRHAVRPRSGWSAVRMWQQDLAQSLQRRHALRLHGWVIGSITLLVTWGVSHLQMAAGVESLALRYLVSRGVGYLAYLCVVRLWAAWLLGRRGRQRRPGGHGQCHRLACRRRPGVYALDLQWRWRGLCRCGGLG